MGKTENWRINQLFSKGSISFPLSLFFVFNGIGKWIQFHWWLTMFFGNVLLNICELHVDCRHLNIPETNEMMFWFRLWPQWCHFCWFATLGSHDHRWTAWTSSVDHSPLYPLYCTIISSEYLKKTTSGSCLATFLISFHVTGILSWLHQLS